MSATSELDFYLLGREDRRTGGHTMFDPGGLPEHVAYRRGYEDEARPITVHVAVAEFTDDMDPDLFIARTLDELHVELRSRLEDIILNEVVPEHWPEVHAYVAAHEGDGSDWATWHGGLHEIDGTPWVTIEEKEI